MGSVWWGLCRYRAVTSAYYRGALGAMLVYDITRPQSFEHIARWVEELRAHADSSTVVMLIGNKADLAVQRAVPAEDAAEFAEEQGLFFSEASALSGENVERAFLRLLEEIYGVVVSRRALERCDEGKGSGRRDVLALKGARVQVFPEMETSPLKKPPSSCSC